MASAVDNLIFNYWYNKMNWVTYYINIKICIILSVHILLCLDTGLDDWDYVYLIKM